MIIRIANSVLETPRWHPLLDTVVEYVQLPDSRLAFDPLSIRAVLASSWIATATGPRRSIADILRASTRSAARGTPSDAVTLIIDDRAPIPGQDEDGHTLKIHPLGALTLLAQPFHLIVEDETTDGGFVLWMARILGRDEVRRAYTAGRLLFRHAGGKGQFVKSARALSLGVWPRPDRLILARTQRSGALLDSDAKYSGDNPNRDIVDSLRQHVAFVHCLLGRTIENYIPGKYLRKRLAADGFGVAADAFLRLPEIARNHFPVKKGFRDRAIPPQPQPRSAFLADPGRSAQEIALFGGIAVSDWPTLAAGFGERLANVYTEAAYRCEPGERNELTAAQRQELEQFITTLVRYL